MIPSFLTKTIPWGFCSLPINVRTLVRRPSLQQRQIVLEVPIVGDAGRSFDAGRSSRFLTRSVAHEGDWLALPLRTPETCGGNEWPVKSLARWHESPSDDHSSPNRWNLEVGFTAGQERNRPPRGKGRFPRGSLRSGPPDSKRVIGLFVEAGGRDGLAPAGPPSPCSGKEIVELRRENAFSGSRLALRIKGIVRSDGRVIESSRRRRQGPA